MPVEIRRNDKGAARSADVQRVTGFCLGGPACRRSGIVQGKIDFQNVRRSVVVARREIAVDRIGRARGVKRAVGEEQLDVIVESETEKALEVTGERDADHVCGDLVNLLDRQRTAARLMTDTAWGAGIGRRRINTRGWG